MFPQGFPVFILETLFLMSKMQIMLPPHGNAENFNEIPAYGQLQKFDEHEQAHFSEQFEQRPNFTSTFKLNVTIRYTVTKRGNLSG